MCVISCLKLLLQLKLAVITTGENVLHLVSMEIGAFGDNIAKSARPGQAAMHKWFPYPGHPQSNIPPGRTIEAIKKTSNSLGLSNPNNREW